METKQIHVKNKAVAEADLQPVKAISPQFVTVFGSVELFNSPGFGATLKKAFPEGVVVGCTTAGEINNKGVFDNTVVVTGSRFGKANLRTAKAGIKGMDKSQDTGKELAKQLAAPDLKAIFVLGQGVNINGSELIAGIREAVGANVVITGGLAGDGGKFAKTYTLLNDSVSSDDVVGVGFYGDSIKIGYGSMGGWEPFGPVRRVTKAVKNVLYQLDGQPALEVYKSYLGEHAKNLPASGLLFPFALLKDNKDTSGLIRTILAVDEKEGSLTFAGDIPENGLVRLMHTDSKGLVGGAENAAKKTSAMLKSQAGGVGILVSCVGRKLVMGGEIDGEVDAVMEILGDGSTVTGFYSYGEICPLFEATDCKLHNQTMTITYLSE